MDKRISQRKAGKFLATAVAGLGLVGYGASQSDAALVIELRALSTTGGTVSGDGKTVNLAGASGQVTLGVFATVTGLNTTVNTADRDGDGQADLQNDEQLQIATGSFKSGTGGLLGNFVIPANVFDPNFNQINDGSRVIPFNGSGSSNGVLSDLDADGDSDIGANGTDPSTMFSARGTSFVSLVQMTAAGLRSFPPGQANAHPGIDDGARTNASGSTFRIGTLRWDVTGGTGSTALSFIPRPDTTGGTGLWIEDGVQKDAGTGSYTAGAPVQVVVPEPASLGLLGLAGLGLLARRRTNA